MENQEEIHDVLTLFEKKPSTDIPQILEDYLKTVAHTGKTLFPWHRVKVLFITKVEQVMEQFNKDVPYDHLPPFPNVENTKYVEMQKRIVEAMQRFAGAPFTVQRICELVIQPRKHYTRCDKFLRGIEKNVMVVGTVDPFGRKIVSESRLMVNGMDTNGFGQKGDMNDFTEGQPFGPVLQSNWSNNNTATVWPGSGILDSVDSLQKLSATVAAATENAESNLHNTNNNHHQLHTANDNDTNTDKFGEGSSTTANVSDTASSRFSALFHEKTTENDRLSPTPGLGSSDSQDLGSFKEESSDVDSVSDSSESGSQKSDSSDSNTSTEDQQEKAEDVTSQPQKEEPPPDNVQVADSRDEEGPPEKKMRVSESSPPTPPVEEEEENETSEAEVAQHTQQPQSTSPADEESAPIQESTEECGSSEQELSATESSEVSQSDLNPSDTSPDNNQSEALAIASDNQSEATASHSKSDDTQALESVSEDVHSSPTDDQSNVSSTDDMPQSDSTEAEAEKENIPTESCDDGVDSAASENAVPESSNADIEAENVDRGEAMSDGCVDVVQDSSASNSDQAITQEVEEQEKMSAQPESECTSATELMETNQELEEHEDNEPQSTTTTTTPQDEPEPMEQD